LEEFTRVKVNKGDKKRELGVAPTLPLVTMIGCLKPQKAPLDYVAVANLVLQEKDAHFILVGDGILREKVEKRMAGLGLRERFTLLGWRRDIPEILAATDIFCLTSLWEGLPRVLPQAMIMGIPIVATKVDGTPEAVTDGENGFLIAPHDVRGMAEKIVYLLSYSDKAQDMGERSKAMVGEFDIWKMVDEQEELYLRLLREKGRVLE
jgi:glycosyltransferase involved in cell wall biosynthesis